MEAIDTQIRGLIPQPDMAFITGEKADLGFNITPYPKLRNTAVTPMLSSCRSPVGVRHQLRRWDLRASS